VNFEGNCEVYKPSGYLKIRNTALQQRHERNEMATISKTAPQGAGAQPAQISKCSVKPVSLLSLLGKALFPSRVDRIFGLSEIEDFKH